MSKRLFGGEMNANVRALVTDIRLLLSDSSECMRMQSLFHRMDADQNGTLSALEFRRALCALLPNREVSAKDVRMLVTLLHHRVLW